MVPGAAEGEETPGYTANGNKCSCAETDTARLAQVKRDRDSDAVHSSLSFSKSIRKTDVQSGAWRKLSCEKCWNSESTVSLIPPKRRACHLVTI